jgi:Trypsin-like peptidase domain/TIR domain
MVQLLSLRDQLKRCTVQLLVPGRSLGTGFFVAPGLILTCAHVVQTAHENNLPIEVWTWDGQSIGLGSIDIYLLEKIPIKDTLPGQKFQYLYPDLALLLVKLTDHPCVYLDAQVSSGNQLYVYGYPDNFPSGDEAKFTHEGESRIDNQRFLLKFREGEARPGFSGAPLLNLNTGGVCGVVQTTRGSNIGGRAIPTSIVLQELSGLADQQQQFHRQYKHWVEYLTPQQRQVLGLLTAADAIEVFYSYAEEDEKLVKELQKQLVFLKRLKIITDWYPAKITLEGEEPDEQAMEHLNSARIILLLVSPDFIFSEEHGNVEVERAMERYNAKEAIVIPINLRNIDNWRGMPFGKLQAIPRNNKSVIEWSNRDAAFAEIAREIRGVVEILKANP